MAILELTAGYHFLYDKVWNPSGTLQAPGESWVQIEDILLEQFFLSGCFVVVTVIQTGLLTFLESRSIWKGQVPELI